VLGRNGRPWQERGNGKTEAKRRRTRGGEDEETQQASESLNNHTHQLGRTSFIEASVGGTQKPGEWSCERKNKERRGGKDFKGGLLLLQGLESDTLS